MRDGCERCGGEVPFGMNFRHVEFAGGAAAVVCNPCHNAIAEKIQDSASYKGANEAAAQLTMLANFARNGNDVVSQTTTLMAQRLTCERELFKLVMEELAKRPPTPEPASPSEPVSEGSHPAPDPAPYPEKPPRPKRKKADPAA